MGSRAMRESSADLAKGLVEAAGAAGVTLACAESCTGGLVAGAITDVPGSSAVFKGGVVAYWPEAKSAVLGVPAELIERCGVVSEEVAAAMAQGARELFSCDAAVATTGVAGPGGGRPDCPVGTVCFGLAGAGGVRTCTTVRGSARGEVRELAVRHALELLMEAV